MQRSFVPALALLLGTMLPFVSACSTVKPWEKGTLAQPALNPSAAQRVAAAEFVNHALDTREGSSGGTGTAGGGCGCN